MCMVEYILRELHTQLVHQKLAFVVRGETDAVPQGAQRDEEDLERCLLRACRDAELASECLKVGLSAIMPPRGEAMCPVIGPMTAARAIREERRWEIRGVVNVL